VSLVFMGTPDFAATVLAALLDSGFPVSGVVCQPDKPRGRDPDPAPPPVKVLAQQRGVEVYQPKALRNRAIEWLSARRPELVVVVAYGRIVPGPMLKVPRRGFVNLHASLLPAYRGAAPIQWAIAGGEPRTGASLMQMDEGLDTGPVLASVITRILPEDTGETLHDRLAHMGSTLLVDSLPGILEGRVTPKPQNDALASWAPVLTKTDAALSFDWPARKIVNRVRGFHPWPGAFTRLRGRILKVFPPVFLGPGDGNRAHPAGTVISVYPDGLEVQAGDGTVVLSSVQLEGKRRLGAKEFAGGARLEPGEKLG